MLADIPSFALRTLTHDFSRRFKSAYMFFSTTKHKEIREELGTRGIAEKVSILLF
jgi:hypothetical protein